MKNFINLKKGDNIWYYDHCKLHKQQVTSIEHKKVKDEWKDIYGRMHSIEDEYIEIKAGKRSVLRLYQYHQNKDAIYIKGLLRFSSYDTAKKYLENLIEYRCKKMEKLKKKYEQELNILNRLKKSYESL